MNENRIVRKGAVREMNRYWLHAASGELSLARDNGKNIEKESEPQIILLNMEEFQQLEGNYPHRKNLISSMRFIRYSKVEAFHECVQGIIHVPKQGSKKEKEFSFGFYLFENKLFLIEEDEELQEINKIIDSPYQAVKIHINKALALYSDKKKPDYENSIKESISAVESLCCIITGATGSQATLGSTLKKLEKDGGVVIHGAMKTAFEKLYGYTSDSDGIRHGGIDFTNAPAEDAKYMLVSCSAFINYLIEKQSKIKN